MPYYNLPHAEVYMRLGKWERLAKRERELLERTAVDNAACHSPSPRRHIDLVNDTQRSLNLSSNPPSFEWFPYLPAPVREHVWKLLIPHRTIMFSADMTAASYDKIHKPNPLGCKSSWPFKMSLLRPLIARVCKESRAVLNENQRQIHLDPEEAHNFALPASFYDSPKHDISIIQHLISKTNYNSVELVKAWTTAPRLLTRVIFGPIHLLNQQSMSYILRDPSLGPTLEEIMLPTCTYPFITGTITLHMSHTQAVESGLFGLLGEQRSFLIPLTDRLRVNRMLELRGVVDPWTRFQVQDDLEYSAELQAEATLHGWRARRTFGYAGEEFVRFQWKKGWFLPWPQEPTILPVVMVSLCEDACSERGDLSGAARRRDFGEWISLNWLIQEWRDAEARGETTPQAKLLEMSRLYVSLHDAGWTAENGPPM